MDGYITAGMDHSHSPSSRKGATVELRNRHIRMDDGDRRWGWTMGIYSREMMLWDPLGISSREWQPDSALLPSCQLPASSRHLKQHARFQETIDPAASNPPFAPLPVIDTPALDAGAGGGG
jgi:hypothetical protein